MDIQAESFKEAHQCEVRLIVRGDHGDEPGVFSVGYPVSVM